MSYRTPAASGHSLRLSEDTTMMRIAASRSVATLVLALLLLANLASSALAAKPFPFEVTIRHTSPVVPVAAGQTAIAEAHCLANELVLGGGVSSGNALVYVSGSSPITNPQGWHVFVRNTDVLDHTLVAWAICGAP
jgi:hypothetical protein